MTHSKGRRGHRRLQVKRVALGCVFVIACGQKDGLGPIEDFVLDFKLASCENDVACDVMPDLETCLASTFPERDRGAKTLGAAVAAGRVTFDTAAGQSCIEAMRGRPCTFTALRRDPEECEAVFVGTIPAGGECVIDTECVTGDCDHPAQGGSCSVGVCARIVQDGESCAANTGTVCREGSYCEIAFGSGTDVCQRYALVGMSCVAQECLPGLLCKDDVCAHRPQASEACVAGTLYPNCDPLDHHCDPVSLTCVPDRAVGEPCDDNYACPGFARCDEGTCEARGTEGDACVFIEVTCLGELACQDRVCVAPPDQNACSLP